MAVEQKILFVSQSIAPYLPADEISSLSKLLPQQMNGKTYEIRTFMPKFGAVNERRGQLHEVIRLSGLNVEINDNDHQLIIKVASMQPVRIQVYFIDNDDYFSKLDSDIDNFGSNRPDNDERALFFARGTMETVKKLRWEPNVIQCSGWMTALVPIYIDKVGEDEGFWKNTKVVYVVEPHNEDMAPLDPELPRKLIEDGIDENIARAFESENLDVNTLHKMAINRASGVVFMTETPDPELLELVNSRGIPYILKEDALKGVDVFKDFYSKLS